MSRILAALGFIAVVSGGCGGDDDGSPIGPTEGKLTVEAQGVTGATGKIVVFSVTASGGGPILGQSCAPVSSDPGSVSAVVATPSATNPCDVGDDLVCDNGSYAVHAGIYTPGSQTAERCSDMIVAVAGDTTVTMPTFGACN